MCRLYKCFPRREKAFSLFFLSFSRLAKYLTDTFEDLSLKGTQQQFLQIYLEKFK